MLPSLFLSGSTTVFHCFPQIINLLRTCRSQNMRMSRFYRKSDTRAQLWGAFSPCITQKKNSIIIYNITSEYIWILWLKPPGDQHPEQQQPQQETKPKACRKHWQLLTAWNLTNAKLQGYELPHSLKTKSQMQTISCFSLNTSQNKCSTQPSSKLTRLVHCKSLNSPRR